MRRTNFAAAALTALFADALTPSTRTGRRKGNKYTPHQGARERQRRRNQIANGQLTGLGSCR